MKIGAMDVFKACDYVPFVSAATNGVTLLAKAVFAVQEKMSEDKLGLAEVGSFKAYAQNASTLRCMLLVAAPAAGYYRIAINVAFAMYDLGKFTASKEHQEKAKELEKNTRH